MEKTECLSDCKPSLYGAVVLYFPLIVSKELLQMELPSYNDICIYKDFIEVTYKEVKCLYAWDVDELLSELFSKCNFEQISVALKKYQGSVLIDVSFCHKERYPTLMFGGKNMDIIHSLHADISIDPY